MRFFALTSLLSLALLGCKITPDPADLLQHMVVQTTQDENTDFGFYSSFTLSMDTLGLYANDPKDTLVLGEYAEIVTNKIRSEMTSAGYAYVSKDQGPDLGFAVTVFDNYNVYQTISYPTYYSGYYGYGYGGY